MGLLCSINDFVSCSVKDPNKNTCHEQNKDSKCKVEETQMINGFFIASTRQDLRN